MQYFLDIDQITSDLQHMMGRVQEIVAGASVMENHCERVRIELIGESDADAISQYELMKLLEETRDRYAELRKLSTSLSLAWCQPTAVLLRDLHNYKENANHDDAPDIG